jgi:uncharacterized protein
MGVTNRPLNDSECDCIAATLDGFHSERAMNLEMLDGFFVALICTPDTVRPSEYLPEIWGGDMADGEAFRDHNELQTFLDLVIRHWNAVAHKLNSAEAFMPLLLQDDEGIFHANDWAQGFMRGMELRRDGWTELMNDENRGGAIIPILALAHEHHPDPEMRPYKQTMSAERREQLIVAVAASVPAIYRYFASGRRLAARMGGDTKTHWRSSPKIGRNDPCPCGSGQKFKKCCGKAALH